MHRFALALLLVPAWLPAQVPQAPAAPPAAESLFDGVSLRGWRGDPAVWRVVDGAIVGSTKDHRVAANTFLIWEGGELADFALSGEVRLEGDNNSGVQYRSRLVPGQEFGVAGYQCDVHPAPDYLGMLYEEKGAGILCQHGQFVARDAAGAVRVVGKLATPARRDLTQWHRLRIVARGNLCWHELDGEVVAVVQDDRQDVARQGLLALQVHSGAPMTVAFRNLELVRFPREELAETPPAVVRALLRRQELQQGAPTGTAPQWLWDEAPQDGEEVFFRRTFDLAALPASARLFVSCDNHYRVYLNGQQVGKRDDWAVIRAFAVRDQLRLGTNALAVHGWNDGGPAGLAVRLVWDGGGVSGELVSDGEWRCSDDDPDNWNMPGFAAEGWAKVRVLGAVGDAKLPWTARLQPEAFGCGLPADAPQVAVPALGLGGPAAAGALQLLQVPGAFGSWVCICADDRGRLYASDQARGLYRITPASGLGELSTIEPIAVDLDGCQGLCWFRGALYAVVSVRTPGLYRLTDRDGDDRLDTVEKLRELAGGGEHGPHAVVPAPDGEALLVLCGNHTALPKIDASRVPTNWGEDRLLPKLEDPNGHAVGIRAPSGYVCRVSPDGQHWELYCCGFRNSYDLAVLPDGQVFTYDSDMEWDMGLPWYRPTRIYQVLSGADYGSRSGANPWPAHFPDSPPAVADVGPGSPTGLLGRGAVLAAFDWTFGTVYRAELAPTGSGHRAQPAAVLTGAPLPVADAVQVGDHVYVLTGGRGLPSSLLRVPAAELLPEGRGALVDPTLRARRERLEQGHGGRPGPDAAECLAWLGADPVTAHAARIALEWLPVERWRDSVLAVEPAAPRPALLGLLALARQGAPADLRPLLVALHKLPFASLDAADRAAWLRVHEVALARLGPLDAEWREELAGQLLPLLPTGTAGHDAALVEILAHLDAKGLLDRAVPLLAPLQPARPPQWAEVITRNASYGGAIQAMLQAMPPADQIAIAYALRTVRHGWTLDQRRAFLEFVRAARQQKGGMSYDGYLKAILADFWAACAPAEQAELAELAGAARAERPRFRSTPPRGPGRDWTVADARAAVVDRLAGADLASGRNLFHATGCAACHYFAGEGGNHGPDLTSLGNKFGAADVLDAILEPSRVVSDQYSGTVLTRRDGSALFGRAAKRTTAAGEVWEVVPAVADATPVQVPVAEVVSAAPSPLSPMPADLVDGLSADELRDLVAFLLSRGAVPPAPATPSAPATQPAGR